MGYIEMNKSFVIITISCLSTLSAAKDMTCGNSSGFGQPWSVGSTVLFKSRVLNIDADGAPNSYLVDGKGLSYTCDGVVALENGKRITPKSNPNNWEEKCNAAWARAQKTNDYSQVAIFGFMTDQKNKPLIQKDGDPFPKKAYISQTSVTIPNTPKGTQRRFVDATKIPYVVLNSQFVEKYSIKPGTLALVYRAKTNKYAFGVFGDGGGLGEASIKLHEDLGSNPIKIRNDVRRAKSRIDDPVLTIVFPQTVVTPIAETQAWYNNIQQKGAVVLKEFGGINQLKKCSQ